MSAAPPAGRELPPQGVLLLLALTLAWGFFWPMMKLSLGELPVLTFRALCAELGGLVLLSIAAVMRMPLRMPRSDWGALVVIALTSTTGWLYFSALSVSMLGSGRAALIAYTMPLWAFLLGLLLLDERPKLGRWFGLLFGLAGVLVLTWGQIASDASLAGIGIALLTAICWATGSVLVKRRAWSTPTPTLAGWQMILGGVPLCILALWFDLGSLRPISLQTGAAVAYSIFIGVAFGVYAWFRVVQLLPMSVASLAVLLVPVVGLLSSAALLGEPLGAREVVAMLLIMAGITTVLPLPRWRRAPLPAVGAVKPAGDREV